MYSASKPAIAKLLQTYISQGGGTKLARGTSFGCQNWQGVLILASFSAKISPAGLILKGTNFGVTESCSISR